MTPRRAIRAIAACLALSAPLLGLATATAAESDAPAPAATDRAADPAFRSEVRRLLTAQNTASMLGEQITYAMAEQTLASIAQSGTEITEPMKQVVLEESRREFGARFGDVEFLTDLYAPIYAEHFTEQEIRELTGFYETPVGKKMLGLMGSISQASFERLQAESFALIPDFQRRVDERLKAEGILVAP